MELLEEYNGWKLWRCPPPPWNGSYGQPATYKVTNGSGFSDCYPSYTGAFNAWHRYSGYEHWGD